MEQDGKGNKTLQYVYIQRHVPVHSSILYSPSATHAKALKLQLLKQPKVIVSKE